MEDAFLEVDSNDEYLYVHITLNKVDHTVEMPTEGMGIMVNIDVDENGKAVGIEIL